MGLVIDTSALVAVERRAVDAKGAQAWADLLPAVSSEPVVLPAGVLAELLGGVAMADASRTRT